MAEKSEKKAKRGRINNYTLPSGLKRFSKSTVNRRSGRWIKRLRPRAQKKQVDASHRPESVKEKPIGGEKNGGTRRVVVKKSPRMRGDLNSQQKRRSTIPRKDRAQARHSKPLRKSIVPGTILILLAGRHSGKRVVFIKQLESGLLLVSGPWAFNRCPLRRINQRYVIATKTRLDVSPLKVPEHVNDAYFSRQKRDAKRKSGSGGAGSASPFAEKKVKYAPSKQRVKDQVSVDKQLIAAVKKHEDGKTLRGYLACHFKLSNKQFPHSMVF